jgi:competence protein ComEC
MFLFDVGFQLSYAAVFAIVSIHPLFMKFWRPTYWLPRRVWELFTVSIAAQLGIIPISLLYFHQFPGLFFISNIVIVPFLGIILGMGILVIALALTGWLPTILATIYNYLITSMNGIIEWIASNESFVFKDIYFSWSLLLTSYFLIICGVLFAKHKTGKYGLAFLSAIVALQSVLLYTKVKKEQTNRLVVFHKSRSTLLAQQKGRTLKLFTDSSKVDLSSYTIKNYKTGENIHTISFKPPQDIFLFRKKKLVVVDSLGVYTNTPKPDYLLLSNSPKINLERLLDSLQPRHVIADGSNYKSFVARWQATAQKRKLPFHYTGEKGAFIID